MNTPRSILLAAVCLLTTSPVSAGVIFSTSYTSGEGYPLNAPLRDHPDWVGGPRVRVRAESTGFVRNSRAASRQPTFHTQGAISSTLASEFRIGDQINIQTHMQVVVAGPRFAQEIARVGFSSSPNSLELAQGFGIVWDEGSNQPAEQSGTLRFFPDFRDYVFIDEDIFPNRAASFSIQGRFVGLDVNNTRGNGADFRSNQLEFSYTTEKISATRWDVVDLSIRDLNTNANFFYDRNVQPTQSFLFDGSDAFFGQSFAIRGRNIDDATARSEFATFNFLQANPVPEPSSLVAALLLSTCGVIPRRRRQNGANADGKVHFGTAAEIYKPKEKPAATRA